MNWIRGIPTASWKVWLGDNIEPLNVYEVERVLCWNLPDWMKDSADLSYKKTFDTCQYRVYLGG